MIPRKLIVLIVATFLGVRTTSAVPMPPATSKPAPRKPAPKIVCEKLLNAPGGADTSSEALRGKVVVLVFWATSCPPCVASIPAMNKLEAAHENDPVVFIHVTDEEKSVVTAFLRKTPIRGWVGIDVARTTFKNYGIKARPTVAVIGKDGSFLGWSDPRLLIKEPEILKNVLATGSSKRLSNTQGSIEYPRENVVREVPTPESDRNLCDIVIRRSDSNSDRRRGGGSRSSVRFARPLLDQLAFFCGVSSSRIIATDEFPEDDYDVITLGKNSGTPAMQEAVCDLLGATFDLSVIREKRVVEVYLLKTVPGRVPTLTPSWGGVYNDAETHLMAPSKKILERMKNGENYFFTLCPLSWLATNLERTAEKPVVLELGDLLKTADGMYSFCFPYPRGNNEAFRKAFEKNVGLTLVPARREVEFLLVEPAGNPAKSSEK